MERDQMLTILLVMVVLISAMQFVQLVTVNNAIAAAPVSIQTAAAPPAVSTGPVSIPALQNLPNMVGGC